MGKRSRTKARDTAAAPGEVGPRQPCPCGSGRRYKACHGAADGASSVFVNRPFAGLPSECDVVALRELVPAATAPLTLADGVGDDRPVQLCSLLPMASPAMVRDSGQIWLGLQVQHNFGDPARDLGAVLLKAFDAEPGIVGLTDPPGEGPRLQDLVTGTSLDVTVHDGFDYWIADVEDKDSMAAALEQANAAATPTVRLPTVEARASSACSGPTACSPPCGTCRSARAPRRWRSLRSGSPRTWPRRSPTTRRSPRRSARRAPDSPTARSRCAEATAGRLG
jgi:uncharacterized protein DUF5926/SEC-C motif-containing protein